MAITHREAAESLGEEGGFLLQTPPAVVLRDRYKNVFAALRAKNIKVVSQSPPLLSLLPTEKCYTPQQQKVLLRTSFH